MKTMTRLTAAAIVVIAASANISHAQNSKSVFNQLIKSGRRGGNGGTSFNLAVQQLGQHLKVNSFSQPRHGGGRIGGPGKTFLPLPPGYPGGHCGTPVCPPPPPVCHIYEVYYYDCHYGWQYYGTYRDHFQAQAAVQMLQSSGYRAYVKTTRQ